MVFSLKESRSSLNYVSFDQAELEGCYFYQAKLRGFLFKKAFINNNFLKPTGQGWYIEENLKPTDFVQLRDIIV